MSHQFKIGDRVRSMDFRYRDDCFVEIIINVIDPVMQQYGGPTVRDVITGHEVEDSSRVGLTTRVPMEGAMHREWEGRLTLVREEPLFSATLTAALAPTSDEKQEVAEARDRHNRYLSGGDS